MRQLPRASRNIDCPFPSTLRQRGDRAFQDQYFQPLVLFNFPTYSYVSSLSTSSSPDVPNINKKYFKKIILQTKTSTVSLSDFDDYPSILHLRTMRLPRQSLSSQLRVSGRLPQCHVEARAPPIMAISRSTNSSIPSFLHLPYPYHLITIFCYNTVPFQFDLDSKFITTRPGPCSASWLCSAATLPS